MDYQLVIVRGRSNSKAIKLADGVTTVGRHDDCQVRIKSSQVSRKHCELFEKKGLLLVKDLGSSNGTYVNGTRIKDQRVLELGDELTLGQIKLKVAKVGEAVPVASVSKPGTTASVEPVTTGGASDDAFWIDFGDQPAPAPPTAPKNNKKQAEAEPAPAVAAMKAPASQPVPDLEPEPTAADAAVADFLLTIKIDDEDE
jgi:pSer/pThr/pTyr-binding forkhead associated (FHA) protein